MAAELLTYANRQKVADALTERGYSVTRMTVNRWARGGEMPEIAARMILDLFGHTPETTKAPPPEWAGAMEQRQDGSRQVGRLDIHESHRGCTVMWITWARVRAGLHVLCECVPVGT